MQRKRRISSVSALLLLVGMTLMQSGCGTSEYGNLAKGLYLISIGFNKLEKFNEDSYRAGDIDKATTSKLNDSIIKAVTLKKRANELMGTIDPNNPTPTDVDSVLAVVQEAATIAGEAQQAGELGIKNPQSKQTFGLILTGITGGIAIARAVKK